MRKRIKRMVLLDSVAYAQKIPIAFNILRAPVIGRVSNFLIPKELQARAALRIAYHDNSKFDKHDVAEYAAPLQEEGAQHALIHSARQIIPENIDALSAQYPTARRRFTTAEPTAAARAEPITSGPVGLADTYST